MRTRAHVLLVACVACGPASDPAPPDGDGSSSTAQTSGADGSAGSSSSTSELDDSEGSGTALPETASTAATDADSTADPSSGVPGCEQVVPGEWNRCWTGASYDGSLCNWTGDPAGPHASCLVAALVENGSVCAIEGCVDRCDCFAPPSTGTATVECMEGIIQDDTACVLYCGDGQTCPDGMVCGYQICVWEPQ